VSDVKVAVLHEDGSSADLPVLPYITRGRMTKEEFEAQQRSVIRNYWKAPLILESKCCVLYVVTPMRDNFGTEETDSFEFEIFSHTDRPTTAPKPIPYDDRPELQTTCAMSGKTNVRYGWWSVNDAQCQIENLRSLLFQTTEDPDFGTIIHAHLYTGQMSTVNLSAFEYNLAEKLWEAFYWLNHVHLYDLMLVRFTPRVQGSLFTALCTSLRVKYQEKYDVNWIWSSTLQWLLSEEAFGALAQFSHEPDGEAEVKETHSIGSMFLELILKKQANDVWAGVTFGKKKPGYKVALGAFQAIIREMLRSGRFAFYNAFTLNADQAYECSEDLWPELRPHFESILLAGYVSKPNKRKEYSQPQVTIFVPHLHRIEFVVCGGVNFNDITEDAQIVKVKSGAYLSIVELKKLPHKN
jgi:hypothetical protein